MWVEVLCKFCLLEHQLQLLTVYVFVHLRLEAEVDTPANEPKPNVVVVNEGVDLVWQTQYQVTKECHIFPNAQQCLQHFRLLDRHGAEGVQVNAFQCALCFLEGSKQLILTSQ